jgi:HlyD family secretion protein
VSPPSSAAAGSSAWLRRRSSGGRLIVFAAALAGLAFFALRRSRQDLGSPVAATRGDLVLTVEVDGELKAIRSTEIGVPPVTEVEFKIAFMAPEGASVRKGDSLLRFDTEALDRQLVHKRAELEEVTGKVEQKRLELTMKRLDLEQQTAQARADLVKAELKAQVPEALLARVELAKARLDRGGRERDVENLLAERRVSEAVAGAELRTLEQQRDRARGRVRDLEAAIEKMNVRAPQDGIVVYRANWRDEKKKVGDSVWYGEVILSLPDLSAMKGDGFVDEADGGPVAAGQPVRLRLEARADTDIEGEVARIGHTVRQRSWRTPLKGFHVEIALARTDPTLMRPAMRFRGEIETDRIPGSLLLPRDSVFLRQDGPVVWVRGAFGWREKRVRLGRGNRTQVEIVEGLREGQLVSGRDLARHENASGPGGAGR